MNQHRDNRMAVYAFSVGVIIGGICFWVVGKGPAEIPTYTARADYYNGMVSNGRDHCPVPPKGVTLVDIR